MKTKLLFTLAFMVIFFSVKSQNSKKSFTLPDYSEVSYNLVDNSFNGPYTIINKDNVLITRGVYTNDFRTGNWYFFNIDGTVFLRYNYDLKKILALDINALAFANVKIAGTNEADNASIPIPIIAIDQYRNLLSTLIKAKIPPPIKNYIEKLEVQIIANIDESGTATYLAKYRLDNIDKIQNFDLVGQKYSIAWIPATLNSVNYKSQFSFNITINFTEEKSDTNNQKRFRWN